MTKRSFNVFFFLNIFGIQPSKYLNYDWRNEDQPKMCVKSKIEYNINLLTFT